MKINKENIEEHIFDYLEGNLSPEEVTTFKNFLEDNPEFKSEIQYWKQSYVASNATVSSTSFSSLKKSNHIYYWTGGVVAAFLLGVGTMLAINNTDEQPIQTETPVEIIEQPEARDAEIKSLPTKEVEIIQVNSSRVEDINNSNDISSQVVPEENNIETEDALDIEPVSQRNVSLEESNSERSVISKKISIEENVSESSTKKKKNKEVDVIELNTEGF